MPSVMDNERNYIEYVAPSESGKYIEFGQRRLTCMATVAHSNHGSVKVRCV